MDAKEFREFGKATVDYLADYIENIRDRDVLPSVEPGYLQNLIPTEAPNKPEKWQDVLKDVERVVMPGITHWHSPHFHAYYPTANSFPGIVGEMLSAGIGCIGFSWISSPACTELEVAMMNWLGKLLQLPEEFLNCSEGPGGGVLQGSASETTLIGLLAAKERTVRRMIEEDPTLKEQDIKGKLIAYTSDHSNSSVEKAGLLGSMPMRLLPADKDGKLRASTLREAFRKDREQDLIPCYVVATLGTTGICACDDLEELGPLCNAENVWLHVDAAYAGAAFICPEYRHLLNGVELSDSFNFNPHKWMLVNFDCSALWVKNAKYLVEAFNVDRIYLQHQHEGKAPDYRHWQISLGRRFRSLKLWFVLRIYGAEGLQNYIRNQIALAKHFEETVQDDPRFEVLTSNMGLVCFRLKGEDSLTQKLLDKLMARKNIYLIPCHYRGKLIIRFVVCARVTELKDIEYSWNEIRTQAEEVVGPIPNGDSKRVEESVIGMKNKCKISEITPPTICYNGKTNGCVEKSK